MRWGLAALLLVLAWASPAYAASLWQEMELSATPVPFTPMSDDLGAQYGMLTYEGGLILSSEADYFGGFSGMAVNENGTIATIISDEGWLLHLNLETQQHSLAGVNLAQMTPLRAYDGTILDDKHNTDAEGFSISPDGTQAIVSFERTPRIWRYEVTEDMSFLRPLSLPLPSAVRHTAFNRGIEAAEILRAGPHAGKILFFLEEPLALIGSPQGWLLDGRKDAAFAVPRTAPYSITDAAQDSQGRIYVLERHYSILSGPRLRIRRFDLDHLLAGYGVGEVLIEAGIEKMVDNFEAIALHETSRKIYITLLSDDNFNALQRTLLLRFSLSR